MKAVITLLLLLFAFQASMGQDQTHVQRLIIKLNQSFDLKSEISEDIPNVAQEITRVSKIYNCLSMRSMKLGRVEHPGMMVMEFAEGTDINLVKDDLLLTGYVELVMEDCKESEGGGCISTPDDPGYYRQWALHNDGTFTLSPATAGADMDMENAWDIEQGDSNIIVAVLSSGVKLSHPELTGRIWQNVAEIDSNGIDDDNNGYVDDIYGWNWANENNDVTDDRGSGTKMAGIIASNTNNQDGFAGIDWHCKVMNLKTVNSNGGSYLTYNIEAIYYAAHNGAKVIVIAPTSTTDHALYYSAIQHALGHGVVVICSIGNNGSDVIRYPSAYDGVIAVGSTDSDDNRSTSFCGGSGGSNYGNHNSVVAPGNYIYGLYHIVAHNYNTYACGSQYAAAHVAGLASLLLAQRPDRTPAQIKQLIEISAEDMVGDSLEDTPGWDPYYGNGRINAYYALSLEQGIDDRSNSNPDLSIFPNPSSGLLNIKISACESKKGLLTLFNIQGQELFTEQLNGLTQLELDLGSLDDGLYIVRLDIGDELIIRKVIIRH